VLHARDKSIRHNEDSVAIVLDFNTVPSAAIPVFPADNDTGIEPAGLTLRWSGGDDIDGDSVTSIVEYSIDGGFFAAASTRNKQLSLSGIQGGANYSWFILTSTAIDTVRSPTNGNTNYHFSTRNRKPQITFISPAAQQVFSAGDSVVLQVSVDDSDGVGTIDSVTFDDKGIGLIRTVQSLGNSSVEYTWKTAAVGRHYVKATITDKQGATGADSLCVFMIPGMRTIFSQGKTFTMGGNAVWCDTPAHSVTFDYGFLIDTVEVPQKSYTAAIGANPSNKIDFAYPVYNLTWYDAAFYFNAKSKSYCMDTVYTYTGIIGSAGDSCELLGVQSHFNRTGFRLPTEAEWEFSCRANTTTLYYWGDEFIEDSVAFLNNSNSGPQYLPGKGRNGFGLYSMLGNVSEWCNDFYAPYSNANARNPTGPVAGLARILRGGSYITYAYSQLTCELHVGANPMLTTSDDVLIGGFTGFRCVVPLTIPASWKQ
jgi:formylglycine-generating enzyme required for sulfatase activity